MKIISYSFVSGGAAIAAKKFADIAQNNLMMDVELYSVKSSSSLHFCKRVISYILGKLQIDHNQIKHSLNLFSYNPIVNLLKSQPEKVFHIHWINNDTISIYDLDKIPSGAIITLHDEWLYCGTEHYETDLKGVNFIEGYSLYEKGTFGINWNFIVWKAKIKRLSYRKDLIYTVPSRWMYERASNSLMLKNADIRLLPNPINTDMFFPASSEQIQAFRQEIGISESDVLVTFGAIGGRRNTLKGASYLNAALDILYKKLPDDKKGRIKLLVFGGDIIQKSSIGGFDSFEVGKINDISELAILYSASNCVVVPSLTEAFGQVAAEASACATPVVSFNSSGLKDIVIDGVSGFAAKPYSVKSLAEKLESVIRMSVNQQKMMGAEGRKHILNNFAYDKVASQYSKIISEAKLKKL